MWPTLGLRQMIVIFCMFQAPYKEFIGHSAHVTNVRLTYNDRYILYVSGAI